jgi:hypothetical protein
MTKMQAHRRVLNEVISVYGNTQVLHSGFLCTQQQLLAFQKLD